MNKIKTLFERDPDNRRYVLDKVTSGCEWVTQGEGIATRKWDGTCVMLDDDGVWWARREVKPGKAFPENYLLVSVDLVTGKTMGWEPIGQSSFAKFHAEAVTGFTWMAGTYELIGPKINGNPERCGRHALISHQDAGVLSVGDLTFDGIRHLVSFLHRTDGIEGIVWHHPDGRMAKIKARDFPDER